MPSAEWVFPSTIEQAVCALEDGASLPVAGGTNLLDLLKLGHVLPGRLVDLSRLPIAEITQTPRRLILGAGAANTQVADWPLVRTEFAALREAILAGASQQIRNAASVAGNLLQTTRCPYFRTTDWPCNRRIPRSGCEAIRAPGHDHAILGTSETCIAVHSSDMAVALLAFDAVLHVTTRAGEAEIPIDRFYALPGQTPHHEHDLPPASLITSVSVPRQASPARSGYLKLRGRASYEFASASIAAVLSCQNDVVDHVAVALGGIATIPWRSREAEAVLVGRPLNQHTIDLFCDRLLEGAALRPETEHKLPLARGAVHRLLSGLEKR